MSDEVLYGEGHVALWVADGVAFAEIRNPPVNASNHHVRAGLLEAIEDIAARVKGGADLAGVLLCGAGGSFVAGSDLREFGAPLAEPQLPQVIAALESLPVPVVAALDGAALGGGYELALACDRRVCAPDAVVGLPEVGLGLVPGAGGTVRLPRLVGVAQALPLICGARRVPAAEALRLGMVDRIAEGALRAAAVEELRGLGGRRSRLSDVPPAQVPPEGLDDARRAALRLGRDRPAAQQAARLAEAGRALPAAEALAQERQVFQQIRMSDEAFALRHLFFAERVAGRVEGLTAAPLPLHRAAVVGVGAMGAGIAFAFLRAGMEVLLVERDAAAAAAGRAAVERLIAEGQGRRRVTAEEAAAMGARLAHFHDIAACADRQLVLEAVVEDMQVKKDLLARLDAVVGAECILASNTSYLDLDEIAAASARPGRVVGLHFFNPAHVMKLLEVVRGRGTDDATLATALRLGRRLGKQAIVAGAGDGFVGNRIYAAYRAQAEMLVEDGALPWQVDAALEAFGFAMGPFAVSDLSGLDIAQAMRRRRAAARDPAAPAPREVRLPDLLCDAGRLGRKTGAGWYAYEDGQRRPDPEVTRLIEDDAAEAGRPRRAVAEAEITARALAALVNEAACVLEDGIAQRPSDIDVAFVHGYGFPRWRGGPLWWAAGPGRAVVLEGLGRVARASGPAFRRGPVEALLDEVRRG